MVADRVKCVRRKSRYPWLPLKAVSSSLRPSVTRAWSGAPSRRFRLDRSVMACKSRSLSGSSSMPTNDLPCNGRCRPRMLFDSLWDTRLPARSSPRAVQPTLGPSQCGRGFARPLPPWRTRRLVPTGKAQACHDRSVSPPLGRLGRVDVGLSSESLPVPRCRPATGSRLPVWPPLLPQFLRSRVGRRARLLQSR